MQYRCTNAFAYGDRVVAGGALVDEVDPILESHAALFVAVAEPAAPGTETADTVVPRTSRKPGRPRKVPVDDQPAAGD